MEDTEARELRELRGKVEIRQYIVAASEKRAVDGAALELNQHFGIGAHRFPLEMLAPPVEERANTDTSMSTVTPRRWLDRLFDVSAASRVGVTYESVAPGVASYPIMKTGPTGEQRAKSQAAAVQAWTVEHRRAQTDSPRRPCRVLPGRRSA